MARWGMVIDLDRCTGCQACVMACKAENNVPAVGAKEAVRGRIISWMQVLTEEDEHDPLGKLRFLPRPCLQCDDPPCTKVCPVYATYLNPEGIVAQIYARCIGCRFCMAACPYNAKYFNWYRYQKEAPGQNPDVSVRPKGDLLLPPRRPRPREGGERGGQPALHALQVHDGKGHGFTLSSVQYAPVPSFGLKLAVPFQVRDPRDSEPTVGGIGDVSLMAKYVPLLLPAHQFALSGGLKMTPTGSERREIVGRRPGTR